MSTEMTPNKKRKLNGQSEPPPLSAIAARKSLQKQKMKRSILSPIKQNQEVKEASSVSIPVSPIETTSPSSDTFALESRPIIHQTTSTATDSALEEAEDDPSSSFRSRAESPEALPETPAIALSSLKPSKDNVRDLEDGTLLVKLVPGERLVILGQFEISVQKGQITLLGATLQPSRSKYAVYVSLSHSLPVIRCLATNIKDAEISLHQCERGVDHLKYLSPLFGRLWNDGLGPLGQQYKTLSKIKRSSFQILFSSNDGPKKAYLQPILSAPEWNEALSRFSAPLDVEAPRMLICGPKSSGKSTFTKLLSNRLLSAATERAAASTSKGQKRSGIAILDLDPGQPEYSVPGQLSLVHVQEPNFGPQFSHPVPDGKSRVIRAHTIAAITPSMDPSHYIACALDLLAHYRSLLFSIPNCPLIVNTPGWVLGTGLEILVDLITKIRPTEVIYMSQQGPKEVVESLQDAAKATPVFTLPSQVSEYVTKTAAHLRTMQVMSYFHLDSTSRNKLAWDGHPLTSVAPWEIRYSGENPGILGIMCYGEQPPADLLLDSINGSLLGIVVVEDLAAIPGWQTEDQSMIEEDEISQNDQPYSMNTGDIEIRAFNDENIQPSHLENPPIVRTPNEDLPYFNPVNAISLNPKHSHCIGLALVRGIDITRRRLQIISPILGSVIEEINEAGKSIVLVSGKFDTPGWAYTEELMQKQSLEKAAKNQNNDDMEVDDEEDEESDDNESGEEGRLLGEGFQNAPWIERQEGSQGRAVGSQVWRVRRDLGRSGD